MPMKFLLETATSRVGARSDKLTSDVSMASSARIYQIWPQVKVWHGTMVRPPKELDQGKTPCRRQGQALPRKRTREISERGKSGLHARRDTRCDAPPDQEISSTLLNASSRNEEASQQTLAIRNMEEKIGIEKERGQRMSEAAKKRDRQRVNQKNAAKDLEQEENVNRKPSRDQKQ
jgi:hypothetical protein